MRTIRLKFLTLPCMLAALITLGCTSEKVVYRSGTSFAAPAAAAASFVGYYDEAAKQTVCGSCHVEKQVAWQNTKHSRAWSDLKANANAAGFCEACHTTNNLGNAVTDTASGYRSTKDARYHDVQCESCHGAGMTHASAPNATNRPLASIKADTNATNGCGECHSGTHDPFAEEWKLSGHSKTVETAHQSTDPYCQSCHTGQGALLAWDKGGNYVEKGVANIDVTCAVCHDPHSAANGAQLRFPLNAANMENNLCIKCHQRRGTVGEVTTRNSVHSPEGPTLLGLAGWFPPGMSQSDSIMGTHSSPAKNPKLCAGCHVQKFQGTDPATKATVFSTGHRFLATPCVGANGLPLKDQTGCQVTAMTFRSCVGGSCHGTESAARNSFNTANLRVTNLVAQANTLIAQAKLGPKKAECTYAQTVPYTSCMGLQFNISVATKVGGVIHNPFLIEQLMIASINQVKKDYNLTASISLEPVFKKGQPMGELPR